MKKVLATILALVMALGLCSVSWATASTLPEEKDGVIKLTANVTTAALQDDVTYDLNNHTLTYSGTGHEVGEGKALTFMDSSATGNARGGTLVLSGVNGATAAIIPQKGATLKVSNIKVTCTGAAFFPRGDAAKVDVIACDVTASTYCVGTNAGSKDNYGVMITLKDSKFVAAADDGDNCAVMINVSGTLNIDNCTITGDRQAVLVRAGTAEITNSDIKTTGKFNEASTKYHSGAWKTGNEVPAAALTVGNYQNGPASAYLAEAKVTVTNTKLTAENGVPAIYTDANDTYKGDLTIGGDSTVVTGTAMKGQKADKAVLAVTGGTFSTDVTEYLAEGKILQKNGNTYTAVTNSGITSGTYTTKPTVPDGYKVVKNTDGTFTVEKVGGYYYFDPTTDTKTDDAKGSPKTFDAGIGIYAVTAVLSTTGMAWTARKRH